MKNKQGIRELAIAGLVLGIIGLAVWLLLVVFVVGLLGIMLLFFSI